MQQCATVGGVQLYVSFNTEVTCKCVCGLGGLNCYCVLVCVYLCVFVCVCVFGEREIGRERDRERERNYMKEDNLTLTRHILLFWRNALILPSDIF